MKFIVPPTEVAQYKYGVYTDRHGFALFTDLGSAKQSATKRAGLWSRHYGNITRRDVTITELVDGEWFVLFFVNAGTSYNDLPWVKEVQTWRSKEHRAVPMTREEYAAWRVRVELERRGIEA